MLPRKIFTGGSAAAHPPQGRKTAGERACRPARFSPGESAAAHPAAGKKPRRGEGVPPRKLFTGGKHRRPSAAGKKKRRGMCHPVNFSPGKVLPFIPPKKKSPQGREGSKKPRRWAGLLNGVVYALPEQPRTSCILWRTSSRMWSRAGVRY